MHICLAILEKLLVRIVIIIKLRLALLEGSDCTAVAVMVILENALVELVLGSFILEIVGFVLRPNDDELVCLTRDRWVGVLQDMLLSFVECITY